MLYEAWRAAPFLGYQGTPPYARSSPSCTSLRVFFQTLCGIVSASGGFGEGTFSYSAIGLPCRDPILPDNISEHQQFKLYAVELINKIAGT